MKPLFLLIFACVGLASALHGEETPRESVVSSQDAMAAPLPSIRIVLNGQEFLRAETKESSAAKTTVYLPEGAVLQDWSEMVTHQLLKLQQRAGADEVVQFIRQRSGGKIRIETVLETRKAAVFVSLSPSAEGAEAQMAIGLAFLDLADPLQVHLVQFVLKPNRLPQSEVEQKLHSWRDLFKNRATALATS